MKTGAWISCLRCGASFACDPAGDCWCKAPPYLPLPTAGVTCLCPDCLARAQEAATRGSADSPSAT